MDTTCLLVLSSNLEISLTPQFALKIVVLVSDFLYVVIRLFVSLLIFFFPVWIGFVRFANPESIDKVLNEPAMVIQDVVVSITSLLR